MSNDSLRLSQSARSEIRQRAGRNNTLSESLPDLDADVAKLQDKLRKAQEKASDVRSKYEYNYRAIADLDEAVTALNDADKLREDGEFIEADRKVADARYRISMYTGRNSIITSNHKRDGYSSY
jgi:predicted nuclease with TOPRIM domain